jgi:hypothetical protein
VRGGGDVGDAEPVESRGQRGDVVQVVQQVYRLELE